ncbi:hypothetical protein COT75_03340 [Candidatus Beckwithbacteria bacterium CG10_big_fil_rev_8_21_14_0_10_34_10]|uniref:EamA domain-containing protein n=1 Tax=Candidatus Beckwithbacteria bacterium CG10_big_fil_rev_8_21_14_0_10_34_10 TaxID=1974495 RepID=A0A2H0W8U5_9BACT|nr:MAG: hypothetical protein COT75_03340 [Candidatus Beckwithbacteria bacterium CG10_big_fil_rev_8_21_14_0_10_34_10]
MGKRLKACLYLLLASFIWGIASPVIKYTLSFVEPFSFLFWRFLLTSIIILPLFIIYLKKNKIKLRLKRLIKISLLGFLGTTFSLSFLFIGYKYTTAIDGVLLYSVAPILVVIGGALFLKEEVTNWEKLGAGLAFIGSLVTIIQPLLEGQAFTQSNVKGNILVFLSAATWALYCLLVRKFGSQNNGKPFVLTSISFIVAFITIIPLFLLENYLKNDYLKSVFLNAQPLFSLDLRAVPGIIYMSLFSTIIAFFAYNMGFSLIEASEATVFDYLKPVIAAPIAVLWLKEIITLPFLIGALLIALGVFLTEYKTRKGLAKIREK